MDEALLGEVLRRLDADEALDEQARLLVFAACQGDADLATVLRDEPIARPDVVEAAERPEPAGAFLRSVTVEGFRGVGQAQTLELTPGPGFTLVLGRNGSGKSSFAEGLELLLTGHNLRWRDRSRAWREGWRNLHHRTARVAAELVEEGVTGSTTVARSWSADADLEDAVTAVQRYGQPREDLDALAWAEPLTAYRPFLSYNELGSMLDEGPSKLYDALEVILGVDDLNAASERLRQARLERERLVKQARDAAKDLQDKLAGSDDPRAGAAAEALSGRSWQLDAVERLVVDGGGEAAAGELALLGALASLHAPDLARAESVANGLRQAARRLAAVAGTDAADAERLAGLLERALELHDHRGDGDCPVCGRQGALDAAWHADTLAEAARLRAAAGEATQAQTAVERALRRAEELIDLPPPVLQEALHLGVETGSTARDWQHWWDGWEHREGPGQLADHIESSLPALHDSLQQVRTLAAGELERRQEAWRPLARELAAWLPRALDAEAGAEQLTGLKAAEAWLKDTTAVVRDARFGPIADACAAHWQTLRQHSNVELGKVVLEGGGPRRRVALDVTVDGVPGAALGVMSQGELHALALSLFLPRATLPESPFRFLVVDDPVQSMDPARIDGLACVLARVAQRRQVVVFTHDERLADAVRRLDLPARVLEVTRRAESVVEIREVDDPVSRLLGDARVLASTDDLGEGVANRVVPGFCRAALEAAGCSPRHAT
ncbi:MAG TPA: AAA family ATPase [Egibacteraceae bacterium]|nr:AAA family ATPase [Egibacteraceae bacterium]